MSDEVAVPVEAPKRSAAASNLKKFAVNPAWCPPGSKIVIGTAEYVVGNGEVELPDMTAETLAKALGPAKG